MQRYRHTQPGWLMVTAVGVAIIGIAILLLYNEFNWIAFVVLCVLALSMVLFASLTVEISDQQLTVFFGPGLIRKSIPLDQILSCQVVTNPWYYGWGIRLTPHGWLWNIAGNQAVELMLKGNVRFRIGTDEPERLKNAIEVALGQEGE